MSKEYRGKYDLKHPSNVAANPEIAEAIRRRALEEGLPCHTAFEIADELSVDPGDVGRNADLLNVRICRCQLGLFGYGPSKRIVKSLTPVNEKLCNAIRERLDAGRLACVTAFRLADELRIGKLTVSSSCETIGVKISSCQLGTF
jgi:hypothetical protein